ncbi:hypothetical protein [Burkholderia ubonensis]|uniref:hypothetical protein n=1 Tax=Burkholderia ubonensis TaxID=101571 RepID=UPI004032AB11
MCSSGGCGGGRAKKEQGARDPKGALVRTIARGTQRLSDTPLPRENACVMVRRRAAATRIDAKIWNYALRATGIATCMEEWRDARERRGDGQSRVDATTQWHNGCRDVINLDEVERIRVQDGG